MTDDDGFADIRFERLGCGRYAVFGQMLIGEQMQMRWVEWSNPAHGFAKLEEEMIRTMADNPTPALTDETTLAGETTFPGRVRASVCQ